MEKDKRNSRIIRNGKIAKNNGKMDKEKDGNKSSMKKLLNQLMKEFKL